MWPSGEERGGGRKLGRAHAAVKGGGCQVGPGQGEREGQAAGCGWAKTGRRREKEVGRRGFRPKSLNWNFQRFSNFK